MSALECSNRMNVVFEILSLLKVVGDFWKTRLTKLPAISSYYTGHARHKNIISFIPIT